MRSICIIRQRGQLTLPRSFRKKFPWIETDQAVTLSTNSAGHIVIRPLTQEDKVEKSVPDQKVSEEPKRIPLFKAK